MGGSEQTMIRLALLEEAAGILHHHLWSSAPREEGAFCLLREGRGMTGRRLLATEPFLPWPGAWEWQEEHSLRPSAQWVSAAVSRAVEARAGLLFVHSHPHAGHPRGLSSSDVASFRALAATLAPILDGPFAAAVVHSDTWSATLWQDGDLIEIDRIVSVGRILRFLSPVPPADAADLHLDLRQRDALGIIHDFLRQLDVAVVGGGGIGSPMAEQLVRMGVRTVVIIDHDRLDTPSNLRRVFGATASDLEATTPLPKVDVVGRHLQQLGLGTQIKRVHGDVRIEHVFRVLLDMDIVIIGTDTHGSRAAVNDLASAYLLPVIDVGVRVGSRADKILTNLVAETRLLTPTTPCLWCRGTISGDVIRGENLPELEKERLRREGYLVHGTGEPIPSVVPLTVLGSGLATCALLALLSEDGSVAPHGYWVDGFLGDAREVGPTEPVAGCWCRSRIGLGDAAAPPFIG